MSKMVSGTTILSERGASLPQTYADKDINRRLRDLHNHIARVERAIEMSVRRGDKFRAERDLRILAEKRRQANALLDKVLKGEYV